MQVEQFITGLYEEYDMEDVNITFSSISLPENKIIIDLHAHNHYTDDDPRKEMWKLT